jgi:hypothetical protein
MANPDRSNCLSFAPGEFQDEFAMILGLRLKHSEWRAGKGLTPVGKLGLGRARANGEGSELAVECAQGYAREGCHGGNQAEGSP